MERGWSIRAKWLRPEARDAKDRRQEIAVDKPISSASVHASQFSIASPSSKEHCHELVAARLLGAGGIVPPL
jgi:hypothetical protein